MNIFTTLKLKNDFKLINRKDQLKHIILYPDKYNNKTLIIDYNIINIINKANKVNYSLFTHIQSFIRQRNINIIIILDKYEYNQILKNNWILRYNITGTTDLLYKPFIDGKLKRSAEL